MQRECYNVLLNLTPKNANTLAEYILAFRHEVNPDDSYRATTILYLARLTRLVIPIFTLILLYWPSNGMNFDAFSLILVPSIPVIVLCPTNQSEGKFNTPSVRSSIIIVLCSECAWST